MTTDRLRDDLLARWQKLTATVSAAHLIITVDGIAVIDQTLQGPATTAFSGASMIKTFLAEMIVDDIAAGRRGWHDEVAVTAEHIVGEDGVLDAWLLPQSLRLANVVQLMIGISDNSATNTVTDLLGGISEVNRRLAGRGYASRIRRHVGRLDEPAIDEVPDPALPTPPGFSIVHPAEHLAALRRCLADGDGERIFGSQADRLSLARHVEPEVWFAHKTGSATGVRHDAGILRSDGHELAISIFTDSTVSVETADHPGCLAAAAGMRDTLAVLGWSHLLLDRGAAVRRRNGPRLRRR